MQKLLLAMLAFVPIAIAASFLGVAPTVVFFLCVLAIIPLAKFIGEATEQIAEHTDPALGGLLNATFGNATELIVGVLALKAGLLTVVRATIAGSIMGNLLLALGISMFVGGLKREKQTFNRQGISAVGTTLLLSCLALIMPAFFVQTAGNASPVAIQDLSVFVSMALIVAYAGSLFFSLYTHRHLYIGDVEEKDPRWSLRTSVIVLCIATVAVAWVSDILVDSITPLVAALGWTPLFVSIIFVAVAGNAAEYASAITSAVKNRMDLAIQISMGSAAQIAQFVAPFLVLASFVVGQPLTLVFDPFELVAMVLAIFIANFVVLDGESNWLEGLQLMVAYLIMAAAFFLHP